MKFNHLTPKQCPSYVHGDEDDFLRKISIRCTWVVSMGYVTIVSKINNLLYTVHLLNFVSCTTYQNIIGRWEIPEIGWPQGCIK